jgi:opacity protein-like surface antigen
MKKTFLIAAFLFSASLAFAGPEPIPLRAAPTPIPVEWYKSGLEAAISGAASYTITPYKEDRYVGHDKIFGGTASLKYFFNEYLGVGLAVSGYDAKAIGSNNKSVWTLPVTFTARYPIGQLAPYVLAGAGAIANGGNSTFREPTGGSFGQKLRFEQKEHDVKFYAQLGAGLQVKLTQNIFLLAQGTFGKIDRPGSNIVTLETGFGYSLP